MVSTRVELCRTVLSPVGSILAGLIPLMWRRPMLSLITLIRVTLTRMAWRRLMVPFRIAKGF